MQKIFSLFSHCTQKCPTLSFWYLVEPLESVSKTSASAYLWTVDQALRQNISDKTNSLLPWADKTEVHVRSTVKGVRGIVGSETFIDICTASVLVQARLDLSIFI